MKQDQFLSFRSHQAVILSPAKIVFMLLRWMWAHRMHRPFEFAIQRAEDVYDFDCITIANQWRGVRWNNFPDNAQTDQQNPGRYVSQGWWCVRMADGSDFGLCLHKSDSFEADYYQREGYKIG